jgi:hypothetical protein
MPVEPLFTVQSAALMIPLTVGALKMALRRHREKLKTPVYRWRGTSRVRYVYASDIVVLRSIYFTGESHVRRHGGEASSKQEARAH